MALPSSPNNRKEVYLSNIAGQGTALPSEPHTREEEYLDYIAKNGGGGTGEGDMTKAVYDGDLAVAGAGGIADYVAGAITGKVDKVNGKGLSSNDYDDSAKAIVDGVTTALDGKVSKSNTAGLLKNDGTVDQTSYATAASVTAIKDGTTIDSFGDVETALANKVDKVSGKGLSTNDYDASAKSKLDNLADIKSIGTGLNLDASGELTATGAGITIDSAMSSSSTNPVQNKVITSALAGKASVDNVKANTQLIADTVGWSGKNILDYPFYTETPSTLRDVVVTQPQKGVINLNGTATGGVVVFYLNYSKKLENGDYRLFLGAESSDVTILAEAYNGNVWVKTLGGDSFADNERRFTVDNVGYDNVRINIRVKSGATVSNVLTHPMLMKAEILDTSFEAPRNTTAFPRDEQAVLGAVNVLNHSATSQTLNTCVITVDAENRTIEFDGTPTGGNASLQLITAEQINALLAKYGDLFLSGCPSGGDENKYSLFTRYGENNFDRDTDNGVWLRASRTYDRPLYAQVIRGTVADHLVFKPMLSKSDKSPYAPYAMTNKELTEKKYPRGNELSSSDDLNNITEDGIYFFSTHPTNGPEAIANGTLIVNKGASGYINQMVISTGRMYTRSYNPEPGQGWYSWYGYIGTSS